MGLDNLVMSRMDHDSQISEVIFKTTRSNDFDDNHDQVKNTVENELTEEYNRLKMKDDIINVIKKPKERSPMNQDKHFNYSKPSNTNNGYDTNNDEDFSFKISKKTDSVDHNSIRNIDDDRNVDDKKLKREGKNNSYVRFPKLEQENLGTDINVSSHISANSLNKSIGKAIQTQNSFPLLQPPRQIVYELNNNHSEDVINILNENSSINSSLSSENEINIKNCCSKVFKKIVSYYYSCSCCYLTSNYSPSSNGSTPFICSWLSIFCCCCPILGAISLFLNARSKKYKLKQKYELAERYSGYAEKLNIAALIFGVIFYAIAFFIITLVIFMFWRSKSS
jgi:hypothetical protein